MFQAGERSALRRKCWPACARAFERLRCRPLQPHGYVVLSPAMPSLPIMMYMFCAACGVAYTRQPSQFSAFHANSGSFRPLMPPCSYQFTNATARQSPRPNRRPRTRPCSRQHKADNAPCANQQARGSAGVLGVYLSTYFRSLARDVCYACGRDRWRPVRCYLARNGEPTAHIHRQCSDRICGGWYNCPVEAGEKWRYARDRRFMAFIYAYASSRSHASAVPRCEARRTRTRARRSLVHAAPARAGLPVAVAG